MGEEGEKEDKEAKSRRIGKPSSNTLHTHTHTLCSLSLFLSFSLSLSLLEKEDREGGGEHSKCGISCISRKEKEYIDYMRDG